MRSLDMRPLLKGLPASLILRSCGLLMGFCERSGDLLRKANFERS